LCVWLSRCQCVCSLCVRARARVCVFSVRARARTCAHVCVHARVCARLGFCSCVRVWVCYPRQRVCVLRTHTGTRCPLRCRVRRLTPLHWAAFHGRAAAVAELLARAADVHGEDTRRCAWACVPVRVRPRVYCHQWRVRAHARECMSAPALMHRRARAHTAKHTYTTHTHTHSHRNTHKQTHPHTPIHTHTHMRVRVLRVRARVFAIVYMRVLAGVLVCEYVRIFTHVCLRA
jgi:hypothetical protein